MTPVSHHYDKSLSDFDLFHLFRTIFSIYTQTPLTTPKFRWFKRTKEPNNNIYGGKICGYTYQSSDSCIHGLELNDLTDKITYSDYLSFIIVINEKLDPFYIVYEFIHLMFLSSKVNSATTSNYYQAMHGSEQVGYSTTMNIK